MRTKNVILTALCAILLTGANLTAQVFNGGNISGNSTDFTIPIAAGTTNLSLVLGGNASRWSYLLIKKGASPADDTDYDFSSQLDGTTNAVYLEAPEVQTGDYLVVRVKTPLTSASHTFTLTAEANKPDVRSVLKPATKSLPGVASGLSRLNTNQYFRVEITAPSYWKVNLSATNGNAPDLYIGKGAVPSTTSYFRRAVGTTNNMTAFSSAEAPPGVYYLGVFGAGMNATGAVYTLKAETVQVEDLAWDPGLTHDGTTGVTRSNPTAQESYFRIITSNPAVGAWRTALKLLGNNDATLYLGKGFLPTPSTNTFSATQAGSVGMVLALGSQFLPGEEWFIMVRGTAGSEWRLTTGTPYVQDLGTLAAGPESSSGEVEIGPEGVRYFKTQVSSDVLAWRLWLSGANNRIVVKKSSVPTLIGNTPDVAQHAQMLMVPPQLTASTYFIGVIGLPGTILTLDSRQQSVVDLPYNGSISANLAGYGYSTYRVAVPPNEIAWRIYLPAVNGNPHVAIRRGSVPNESANEAMSELTTTNADNVTLVPPALSDANFYITVYSTNQAELTSTNVLRYTLQEGTPEVTDIPYHTVITNDDPTRSGWRFYRISDVNEQLNSLGWNLYLSNATPGTRIALRRANVPSLWTYRNPNPVTVNSYDVLSTGTFLQRPDHEPDIWYIGIYNPTNVLGPFVLTSGDLTPRPLTDSTIAAETGTLPGRWEFFSIELSTADVQGANAVLGWDLRLTNISGGAPKIIVRKDKLPVGTGSTFPVVSSVAWPAGGQCAAGADWTKRTFNSTGLVNEDGRILSVGLNRPLTPGTYYIGVYNSGTNAGDFGLLSRWIGVNRSIPVVDLNYSGSSVTNSLPAREAAYYRVTVPAGSSSWKTRLQAISGESMMVVMPNTLPGTINEKRMQKPGDEYYLRLPDSGSATLPETTYYIAVISEGEEPTATKIGANGATFAIHSLGAIQEVNLGTLAQTDLTYSGQLASGDTIVVRFQPVPETWGFWSVLEDVTGNPWEVIRSGTRIPDPGTTMAGPKDTYGFEGGQADAVSSSWRISSAGAGHDETIILKARSEGTLWEDAAFVLRIRPVKVLPLTFDGGIMTITNGEPDYGDFFLVDVPEDALGWDVRATNVVTGNPRVYVGKDYVPLGPWAWGNFIPWDRSSWASGAWIDADYDWTERPLDAEGDWDADRIFMVSKGRPMVTPGRYFVHVVNEVTSQPVNCQIVSRGVSPGMSIPITPLAFAGGTVEVTNLPPREAVYYRIEVPTNAASWKVRLTETQGEAVFGILRDRPPNIGMDYNKSTKTEAGRRMQRVGDETWLLLPPPGRDTLEGGTYYLSAVAEGMTDTNQPYRIGTNSSSFQIVSMGEVPRLNLGNIGPAIAEIAHTNNLIGGDTQIYEVNVASGTMVFEARLETRSGNPAMSARFGTRVPDPTPAVGRLPLEYYGVEGGENNAVSSSTNLISWSGPSNGVFTILVKARNELNASYVLRVNTYSVPTPVVTPVGFDVSDASAPSALLVSSHAAKTWAYYTIEVPTNTMGWDVRLTGVAGGAPKFVVRRGTMPTALSTSPWTVPGNATTWPTNSQWAPGADWTKRTTAPDGTAEDGRILAVGMGRPLEPGLYYIGVYNNGTNASTYTVLSRGIGAGFSIPILDLPFSGSITNLTLSPREAAYYRIVTSSNATSWKLQVNILTNIGGECMLTGLRGNLPNFSTIAGTAIANGKTMQKPGNEHFVLLPTSTQTNLGATTNYFAVVGEGKNPGSATKIGTGETGYVITSEPQLVITELGIVTSEDIVQPDTLQAGEVKAYKFTIFPGTYGAKLKLEDRAGNPVAVLVQGNKVPNPGAAVSGAAVEAYGNEGGVTPNDGNPTILTLANATPGNYIVLVKARASGTTTPDASYTLRITEILTPQLNFSHELNTNGLRNYISGILENNERVFYRFDIPADLQGKPIIGWKLLLSQSSGSATLRVSRDVLPQDGMASIMDWTGASAVIAPPYLTNGVWFVEVRGSNATAFTLTSEALELDRPEWVMPEPGQPNPNPGVLPPYFGDTAVGTNGQPIEESVFLEQGMMHYYAVRVPTNNLGMLRMELRASSGNPDLFLRTAGVPSLQHSASGSSGTIYDRSMTAARDTEYANWVPMDGKTEVALQPGLWYIVVKASGTSNARYRLLVSTGNIVDLTLDGGLLTNQVAPGGDWLYYRITAPLELPGSLGVVFDREYGDGVLYVRDVIPPGNGSSPTVGNIRDWATDAKNTGPYPNFGTQGEYKLNTPPVRPGETLYLGLQAPSRSIFSIRVTNYSHFAALPDVIEFYGGSASFDLGPGEKAIFKVSVPGDAARWRHASIHTTNIVVSLDQGTVPEGASYEWRSTGTNSGLNQPLLVWNAALSKYVVAAWPWVPGQNYYFSVTNKGLLTESVTLAMDGRNQETDDNDNNGLPDGWEMLYFGRTGQSGTADPDRDAVVNIDEYIEGTNPNDASSFNARLFILSPFGQVWTEPNLVSYPLGTPVLLTAFADPGYAFSSWGQDLSGKQNPKTLVMNGHKTITVTFHKSGDDFLSALSLSGESVLTSARNVGYTRELGEPFHAGNYGGRSVWWRWTAPLSGPVTISTANSTFNTLLAVYRATLPWVGEFSFSAVNLTQVAADNNGSGIPAERSRVTFNAIAGIEYHFAVDGFDGASANIVLSLNQTQDAMRPVLGQCSISETAVTVPVTGAGGQTYTVQHSSDLKTWVNAGTITLNAEGQGTIIDNAPPNGMRFYRLKQ